MRTAYFSFVVILLSACSNPKMFHPVEFHQEFLLKYRESATVKSENLTIRFIYVIQDSRCPKEVQCIQAGKAQIAVEVGKSNERLDLIELSTEPDSSEIRRGDYSVRLLDVLPYPTAGERTDQNLYSVRLILTKE